MPRRSPEEGLSVMMENINPITREEIYNVLGLHFSESSIKTFPATTSATLLYIISRSQFVSWWERSIILIIISSSQAATFFATSTVQVKNKNNQSNRISFHTAYYLTIRFLCLLFNASNNNICIASPLPLLTYVSDVSYRYSEVLYLSLFLSHFCKLSFMYLLEYSIFLLLLITIHQIIIHVLHVLHHYFSHFCNLFPSSSGVDSASSLLNHLFSSFMLQTWTKQPSKSDAPIINFA